MLEKLAILTATRCDLKSRHCLRGHNREISDFPLELLPPLLDEARRSLPRVLPRLPAAAQAGWPALALGDALSSRCRQAERAARAKTGTDGILWLA